MPSPRRAPQQRKRDEPQTAASRHPCRAGAGLDRRVDRCCGLADPHGDDVLARSRQPIPARPRLRTRRQPELRPAAGVADRARRRRRDIVVLLRDGSGRRRFSEPSARCPCRRTAGHVLGIAQLAEEFRRGLGDRGRFRRCDLARRAAPRSPPGPDPPHMDRNPGEPVVVGDRHRRFGRNRAFRRRPARSRQHRRDPGTDPASGARRRPRHAFGDKIPERPQRCDRRDA